MPKADIVLQVLAAQISEDIISYISNIILPDVFHPEKLNWPSIRALLIISAFKEGLKPASLARITKFDPATIVRIFDQLADCDYAFQETNAHDARSLLIKITPQGEEFVARFFAQYHCQNAMIVPSQLPKFSESEVIDVFQACFSLQERAERLASITPRGKMKFLNIGQFSHGRFNENFEFYSVFPDFALHMICNNISEDYLTFLNTHIIKKMLKPTKLKIRELKVLMCIHHNKLPTVSSKIARTLRMDPATITRASKVLIENGYLEIFDELNDDRSKPLWMTQKGLDLSKEYIERVDEAFEFAVKVTGQDFSDLRKTEMLDTLFALRKRSKIFAQSKRCRNCKAA